jgi:import inner membrane translocase subunit TIM8
MAFGGSPGPGGENIDPEVQRAVLVETERAKFTSNVHSLSDVCWDKCVDKIYNKTDNKAQKCIANCVDRFLDTQLFITKRVVSMGQAGGHGGMH